MEALLAQARPLLAPAFTLWGSPASWMEVLAFALSLAMVACNLRVNPAGWPLAIAASLLYALVFVDAGLYGEAGLQLVFIAAATWGWWQWLHARTGNGQALVVHRLERRTALAVALGTLGAWPLLGAWLDHATDSTVPYLDALPTVASVTGQLLLARKLVENWPVWLGVNLASVVLFAYKELWLTAMLYAIFALLSVVGWQAWRRLERQGLARG